MSHKNKKTLRQQANERMNAIFTPGKSKHETKQLARAEYEERRSELSALGITEKQHIDTRLRENIYSYGTYTSYAKHQNYFFDWCRAEHHEAKTLDDCRQYADEWLKQREGEGKSAYTLKLEVSSLAKLYGEPSSNFYATPERDRSEITRSRGTADRDYGFSLEKNAEIVDFARGTGLRRSELESLKGSQLTYRDDEPYLEIKGKGGRERLAPIIGPNRDEIVARCEAAGDDRVWERVPSHMDVHSYRSQYATAIYEAKARDIEDIPSADRYCCRGDLKGTTYDREALREASEALGHSRESVVAEHYIRGGR